MSQALGLIPLFGADMLLMGTAISGSAMKSNHSALRARFEVTEKIRKVAST